MTIVRRLPKTLFVKSHAYLAPILPDRHLALPVPGGRIYLNVKESPMMLARAFRLYEVGKVRAIKALLRLGETFIDVGANKGDFTVLAASIVSAAGKVLSFEPEPTNCYWLRKSIRLNGYHNIALHEMALSDTDGEVNLYLGEKSGWHTLLPGKPRRDRGVIHVARRALDTVLEETGQEKVDMIKIDVEGAELEVLRGAIRTLSSNKGIRLLLDIHPKLGVDPREVCLFLGELGFSMFRMRAPFDTPVQMDPSLKEVLARRASEGGKF
jgi:FkbM family methyltransferase